MQSRISVQNNREIVNLIRFRSSKKQFIQVFERWNQNRKRSIQCINRNGIVKRCKNTNQIKFDICQAFGQTIL